MDTISFVSLHCILYTAMYNLISMGTKLSPLWTMDKYSYFYA